MIHQLIAISSISFYFYFSPIFLKKIWPIGITSDDQAFYMTSLIMTHAIVYAIVNSIYYIFYHFEFTYFEQFRTEKGPWPWNEDKQKWRITMKKTAYNFALNFLVSSVLGYLESVVKISKRLDNDSFPTYSEMLWQIAFSALLEDFGFYWVHRLLHHSFFYKYIHKQHHEYNITSLIFKILITQVSVSAEYANPIEFIFGNTIPVALGPKLLGRQMHQSTLIIWIAFRIIKTLSAHSGYSFPWDPINLIPLGTPPEFHSLHHSRNIGNYGSILQFWDILFKTDQSYKVNYIDKINIGQDYKQEKSQKENKNK